ncbi:hypothetical protein [Flavobacterium sp. 245]|uniref:hypothetical protein n=1 Tax=Flavobacterium sp. 245 TaxID=2512115 RepID=UPI001060DF42|nr:hypothetical protein [Flavobacterium sp. 245]TDP03089.1 hypothetical protein EV145_102251 [Flavobacterium sp. 245]
MKQREFTSIGFILALTILLLNDFYFKIYYGNWLTGKLSDFAGLFIFPLFWTILFPKLKDKIYFASAIIFIYWKTVYSEALFEIINQLSIIKLNRVVDLTDLLALLILPISYSYHQKVNKNFTTINPTFIVILTSFSFIATSYDSEIEYKNEYTFDFPIDTLKTKIYYLKTISNQYEKEKENYILDSTGKYKIHKYYWDTIDAKKPPIDKFVKDTMDLFIFEDFCFEGYDAKLVISGDNKKSKIKVLGFHHKCPTDEKTLTHWNNDEEILSKSFEKKVIEQLK